MKSVHCFPAAWTLYGMLPRGMDTVRKYTYVGWLLAGSLASRGPRMPDIADARATSSRDGGEVEPPSPLAP